MFCNLIEILSWGFVSSSCAVIVSAIFEFDKKVFRNVVIGAFFLGCIRGYTGKDIISLLAGL